MGTCSFCKKNIGLLTKEYDCSVCGSHICAKCTHKWRENVPQLALILDRSPKLPFICIEGETGYLPVCPACLSSIEGMNYKYEWALSNCEDVEIVSANYKGHKRYDPNSRIDVSSNSYKDRNEAKRELCAMAKYYGRDMIIECECEKQQHEDGNYIYNTWSYSGIAVNKQ